MESLVSNYRTTDERNRSERALRQSPKVENQQVRGNGEADMIDMEKTSTYFGWLSRDLVQRFVTAAITDGDSLRCPDELKDFWNGGRYRNEWFLAVTAIRRIHRCVLLSLPCRCFLCFGVEKTYYRMHHALLRIGDFGASLLSQMLQWCGMDVHGSRLILLLTIAKSKLWRHVSWILEMACHGILLRLHSFRSTPQTRCQLCLFLARHANGWRLWWRGLHPAIAAMAKEKERPFITILSTTIKFLILQKLIDQDLDPGSNHGNNGQDPLPDPETVVMCLERIADWLKAKILNPEANGVPEDRLIIHPLLGHRVGPMTPVQRHLFFASDIILRRYEEHIRHTVDIVKSNWCHKTT